MAKDSLKISAVQIHRPAAAASGRRDVASWLDLSVEVENTGDKTLHVWATHRAYDYDEASHVLTVRLAEVPLNLPPGVILLSDHPRSPQQVEVAPRSSANLRVRFPPVVRRAAKGGHGWTEHPIGQVARVDVDVQYGSHPVESPREHEPAAEFRKRMLDYGAVAHAMITPTVAESPRNEQEQ